ncbi:MAG: PHP domain-containing protein [Acidimicrobiia bacterium]|nr:PHP domain-containing protein [Acidimicrobiia bacterium]
MVPDDVGGSGTERPPYRVALERAIYLMDRGMAPTRKVRAFTKGLAVLSELAASGGEEAVEELTRQGRLTTLGGIGPSIEAVVAGAYGVGPTDYLDDLETSTMIDPGRGHQLRAMLKGDCHSHSSWSDGGAELRAMAEAARSLGHEYLVATDHSARLTVAHGLSPERLEQQLVEIERLNQDLAPFRLLTGMEVDILDDGRLDLPDDLLARLDVVIASVHHRIHQRPEEMTRRLVRAVAHPHVDILGHCTNRKVLGSRRKPSQFDADYVFAACARFNTAVEINCRPERQDPPEDLLELALEWDCMLSIDSDAHAPGQLEWVNYGCDKAARAGIEPDRIVNTRSADELLDLVAA